MSVTVLGAGMAGFGAASHFHAEGVPATIYEEKPYFGGHTSSYTSPNGFTFDEGGHISFTKEERIQKLLADNVNGEYEVVQARVNNYWKGLWIKHPVQCNLYDLPIDLKVDILRDFVATRSGISQSPRNYGEWLIANYGKTFAEMFPMEYGLRYHTTTAQNMTTDWLGPRMYVSAFEEMLRGALTPETPDVHYVDYFRYPSRGGFVSYLKPFADVTRLELNHKLTALNAARRELFFANGNTRSYEYVISSIPLPELIPLIQNVPSDVLEACEKLAWTTCVLVDIGIDREDISDAHWSYFYDRDIFFARTNCPGMLSPHNVPRGTSSIQADAYFSRKYRPLDRSPQECIESTIADLRRCGLIRADDKIIFQNARIIPYANIIYDLDRYDALAIVHGYLDDIGVFYCGRYGEWNHYWTDEAFVSGEKAAQKVLDSMS